MEKHLTLKHEGLRLAATLHYPTDTQTNSDEKRQAIIICHGFIGSRVGVDRLFVKAARALAAQGSYVLRFDYGGCGESTGDYGELGFDSMVEQTRTAINYIASMEAVDPRRIVLLGHSLGGAISIMTAVKDRRVKRLVLWSPVAYPFNDIVRIVGRDSYDDAVSKGSSDYQGYTFKPVFFDSLLQHQPLQAANKFNGEVLLIHGTSDEVIPVDYTFLFQKVFWTRGDGLCDKEIIFQANHTYSCRQHQQDAIQLTLDWLTGLSKKLEDWQNWSI